MSRFYKSCRPAVRTSIQSLQFINHLKAGQQKQAVELLQQSELKKYYFVSNENANPGRKCIYKASDLSKLFCVDLNDKQTIEANSLLQHVHVQAVSEFVNKEIVAF